MAEWIVDGNNVMGSRPDGWWRDRRGAQRRLVERLETFADARDEPVTVIFDGRAHDAGGGSRVAVRSRGAPGATRPTTTSPRVVARHPDPGSLTVVTSDGALADARARRPAARSSAPGPSCAGSTTPSSGAADALHARPPEPGSARR